MKPLSPFFLKAEKNFLLAGGFSDGYPEITGK